MLLAATPLLTRLYSAADFGGLALFTSISTVIALCATGRYEYAIGLPNDDVEGWNVVLVVCTLGATFSALLAIGIGGWHLSRPAGIGSPASLWCIPVYTLLASITSALQYWNGRKKEYRRVSTSNVAQALTMTLLSVGFGWLGCTGTGLVWGLIAGQVAAITFLGSGGCFAFPHKVGGAPLLALAKRYINFPKYQIASDLSASATVQLPLIAFSHLFNMTFVGHFSIANRMLRIPNIALTASIGHVFRNEAIDALRTGGSCSEIYLSTFKKLATLSISIYLVLGLSARFLFALAFGPGWEPAGYCAQLICIMVATDFVAQPLSMLFSIRNRQGLNMLLQIASFISGVIAILGGYWAWRDPFYCIILLAGSTAMCNIVSIMLSWRLSFIQSAPATAPAAL
jgi:O-antigen/teichoic acid export membrane protein